MGRARTLFAHPSGRSIALCAALVLGGCGGSSHASSKPPAKPVSPLATVCTLNARLVIGEIVHVPPGSIARSASMSDQGYPQCVYRAPGLRVTAIVDSGPQAYFRLERTIVEAGQQFGTVRVEAPPVTVPHLGLDASWFPTERHVMTTDGKRLITVRAVLARAGARRERSLSIAVARSYLVMAARKHSSGP